MPEALTFEEFKARHRDAPRASSGEASGGGDDFEAFVQKHEGDTRLEYEPGEHWSKPLDIQHPDLGNVDRAMLKTWADAGPETMRRNLEKRGFEARNTEGMDFALRKPGEKKWHVMDQSRIFGGALGIGEPIQDVAEVLPSYGMHFLAAMGLSKIPGLSKLPMLGRGAAYGTGSAAVEALKQSLAPKLGFDVVPEEAAGKVGMEAAFTGAAEGAGELLMRAARSPLGQKVIGAGKKGLSAGARGIGRVLGKGMPPQGEMSPEVARRLETLMARSRGMRELEELPPGGEMSPEVAEGLQGLMERSRLLKEIEKYDTGPMEIRGSTEPPPTPPIDTERLGDLGRQMKPLGPLPKIRRETWGEPSIRSVGNGLYEVKLKGRKLYLGADRTKAEQVFHGAFQGTRVPELVSKAKDVRPPPGQPPSPDEVTVWRIQPRGADLHGVETETSAGELAGGVHVFETLEEAQGVRNWLDLHDIELVQIRARRGDLRPNGDFEGVTLIGGRGEIVGRQPFQSTREAAGWIESEVKRRHLSEAQGAPAAETPLVLPGDVAESTGRDPALWDWARENAEAVGSEGWKTGETVDDLAERFYRGIRSDPDAYREFTEGQAFRQIEGVPPVEDLPDVGWDMPQEFPESFEPDVPPMSAAGTPDVPPDDLAREAARLATRRRGDLGVPGKERAALERELRERLANPNPREVEQLRAAIGKELYEPVPEAAMDTYAALLRAGVEPGEARRLAMGEPPPGAPPTAGPQPGGPGPDEVTPGYHWSRWMDRPPRKRPPAAPPDATPAPAQPAPGRPGPRLIETPHGYEVRDGDRVIVGFSKDDPMAVFNAERALKEANDRWAAGEPVDPRQARLRGWEDEQAFKKSMEDPPEPPPSSGGGMKSGPREYPQPLEPLRAFPKGPQPRRPPEAPEPRPDGPATGEPPAPPPAPPGGSQGPSAPGGASGQPGHVPADPEAQLSLWAKIREVGGGAIRSVGGALEYPERVVKRGTEALLERIPRGAGERIGLKNSRAQTTRLLRTLARGMKGIQSKDPQRRQIMQRTADDVLDTLSRPLLRSEEIERAGKSLAAGVEQVGGRQGTDLLKQVHGIVTGPQVKAVRGPAIAGVSPTRLPEAAMLTQLTGIGANLPGSPLLAGIGGAGVLGKGVRRVGLAIMRDKSGDTLRTIMRSAPADVQAALGPLLRKIGGSPGAWSAATWVVLHNPAVREYLESRSGAEE